jgi:osmotically-inducible protein OsmY
MERKDADQLIDVEEAARIRLQHSPYRALRRVTCEFIDGTLYLQGRVATYHYKQLAQVAVLGVDGVQRIVNELEVEATV